MRTLLALLVALLAAGCDKKVEVQEQPAAAPPAPAAVLPAVTIVGTNGWTQVQRTPPDEFGVACYFPTSVGAIHCVKVRAE